PHFFSLSCYCDHRDLHSFPTRRSSDLTKLLQRLQRNRPSSFLAKRVVVVEGKTEHGLMLAMFDAWNKGRALIGLSSTAGEGVARSEEHTSELQSRENLVCRLLLEKKKK